MQVILKEHNTEDQLSCCGHNFEDTRKHLVVGKEYEARLEAHQFHSSIIMGEKRFNCECFVEVINKGLTKDSHDSIYIYQRFEEWEVLSTTVGGNSTTVIFNFTTKEFAAIAGQKIANAIGGKFYGEEVPK